VFLCTWKRNVVPPLHLSKSFDSVIILLKMYSIHHQFLKWFIWMWIHYSSQNLELSILPAWSYRFHHEPGGYVITKLWWSIIVKIERKMTTCYSFMKSRSELECDPNHLVNQSQSMIETWTNPNRIHSSLVAQVHLSFRCVGINVMCSTPCRKTVSHLLKYMEKRQNLNAVLINK